MLLFAPPRFFHRYPPARSIAGIPVCEEHRSALSLEALLSDAGFETLCRAFRLMGKVAPERSATKLDFIDIDSAEARSFLASSRASDN